MISSQAFPAISRKWLLRTLRGSGCSEWLLEYLVPLLNPSKAFVSWEGRLFDGIDMESGVPQGRPVSALLSVLGPDAWVRKVYVTFAPPSTLSLFADDLSRPDLCVTHLLTMEPLLCEAQEGLSVRPRLSLPLRIGLGL